MSEMATYTPKIINRQIAATSEIESPERSVTRPTGKSAAPIIRPERSNVNVDARAKAIVPANLTIRSLTRLVSRIYAILGARQRSFKNLSQISV